jgi:glycosyltransferase involved in cell wall biosynthesis
MDHVIAVSSELRDLLVHDFEVSPERISVRFNGIDPKKFSFQDQSQARGRLNLPSQAKILIHVARLSIEKRHTILLQALEQGGQEDFHVYFLGEGPLRAEIEAEVNQRNLQNRVFLKGGIPHGDLPAWFAAADLFCLSSAHEGCPVVIQEALACGTPVVSTRVGAVPDLLASCDGIVCDGESPQALAAALQEAFARRWDRPEIAERGGRRSWTAVADDLLDIYRDLPPR